MKKILLLLFISPIISFAQKGIDNLWTMGYHCCTTVSGEINIDFLSGSPSITYVTRKMSYLDISATICDSNGKMLFSTNGIWIANANSDTMMNGSGLNPSYFTSSMGSMGLFIPQSALIIPLPGDSARYYIVHGTIDDSARYAYKIYFSEIDMNLDGGLGRVVSKNNVLLNDILISGGITSVKHANGRDWWVVFHKAKSDVYYIYLADPSGIHFYASQKIGVVRSEQNKGQLCFSPDGSKFAYYNGWVNQDLDIMDFDRCSGTFSNLVHIDINDSTRFGGVAFSPNSQVLYLSSGLHVYQFDLTASNIPSSKLTVAVWDTFYSPSPPLATTFYLSQLAPDGRIYISSTNSVLSMHVINDPNMIGLASNVCQHCLSLSYYNAETIPNHPNYHLGALVGSPCDTLGIGIEELTINNNLNIFPNPVVNGEVTFTYSSTSDEKTISIFNIDGQEMATYHLPQWSSVQRIKLPQLAKGVYLARLFSTNNELKATNCKFMVE